MERNGWLRSKSARTLVFLLAAAVAVTIPVALATASKAPQGVAHASRSKATTVKIVETAVGPMLVTNGKHTIYMFERDKKMSNAECAKIKGCDRDWPVLTTVGKPIAGPGVKQSLLGTIPYKGKLQQVTYNGYALHVYLYDYTHPSLVNIGNGQYGGKWYPLDVKGHLIK